MDKEGNEKIDDEKYDCAREGFPYDIAIVIDGELICWHREDYPSTQTDREFINDSAISSEFSFYMNFQIL